LTCGPCAGCCVGYSVSVAEFLGGSSVWGALCGVIRGMLYYGGVLCVGVIFDLWTLCGVLCGVFCECGGISRGILCVGALCGVIPLLAVFGVFLRLEAVCVFFYVCGVVWGRVCE
jgi:hypothetical protein